MKSEWACHSFCLTTTVPALPPAPAPPIRRVEEFDRAAIGERFARDSCVIRLARAVQATHAKRSAAPIGNASLAKTSGHAIASSTRQHGDSQQFVHRRLHLPPDRQTDRWPRPSTLTVMGGNDGSRARAGSAAARVSLASPPIWRPFLNDPAPGLYLISRRPIPLALRPGATPNVWTCPGRFVLPAPVLAYGEAKGNHCPRARSTLTS
jgi:hypothetical protein